MNTRTLPRIVESKTKVRFPDCDPFNHLNNSKYIDYIINAREDQLLQFYDFDVYKMARETGNTWVVAQTQIAYLSSAELMEVLTIQTRMIACSRRSLQVEALMYDEHKTQLKAVMWIKLAYYDLRTRKSQEHSSALMSLFDEICEPLSNDPSFEERVKSFKQTGK